MYLENKYLTDEISLRVNGKFPYQQEDIDFLDLINSRLEEIEDSLTKDAEEDHPNIWILGVSRSGTTLLSQLVFNCLDIACTNNFMARFWKVPVVGCLLSKIILGDRKSNSFASEYGKTKDAYSPHEFGWFWQNLLQANDLLSYNPAKAARSINWDFLRLKILNMNRVLEKGIIFKPLEYAAYHFEKFNSVFPKSIFIYISRDSRDVAFSLAKARLDYYKNIDTWWGSIPLRDYPQLTDKPFWQQIAGQIFYLKKMYEEDLEKADRERLIFTSYDEICSAPQEFLNQVIETVRKLFSYELRQINKPPDKFVSNNKQRVDKQIEERLVQGLKLYDLLNN